MSSQRSAPACLGTAPQTKEEWVAAIGELVEWVDGHSATLFTASPTVVTLQWLGKWSLGNKGALPAPSAVAGYWRLWALCLGSGAGGSRVSAAQAGTLLDSIAATARTLSSRQALVVDAALDGDRELSEALALCARAIFRSSLAGIFQFEKVAQFTGAVAAALLRAAGDDDGLGLGNTAGTPGSARLEVVPLVAPLFQAAAQALLARARSSGNQRKVFSAFFASPEPLLLPLLCVRHAAASEAAGDVLPRESRETRAALESSARELLLAAAFHDDHMRDYGSALSGVDTKAEETLRGRGSDHDQQKEQGEQGKQGGKGKGKKGKKAKGKKGDASKGDALVSYHRKLFQTLGQIMACADDNSGDGKDASRTTLLRLAGPVSETNESKKAANRSGDM